MRTLRVLCATTLLSFACGGAASPPAPSVTAATTKASPAAECLAIADALHPATPSQPDHLSVKHVLVKWTGSNNPVASITRGREDACLRALAARDALRSGADFDEVVKTYSDETGAASRGGSLGMIERKTMVAAFSDAAFELAPGEFSDVVETEFGFHVIMRTQ